MLSHLGRDALALPLGAGAWGAPAQSPLQLASFCSNPGAAEGDLGGDSGKPAITPAIDALAAALLEAFGIPGLSDRKSTRLNSSHSGESRMPSSA